MTTDSQHAGAALPPGEAAAPEPTDRLLRHPSFLRFWSGRLAGTMGNQMLLVAVGWQMYDLTGSAWDLGLVGLYQFLPALALTLVAGHVADRHDRRRVVAGALAVQLVAALTLVPSVRGGFESRTLILGISFLLGVSKSFQMTAQQALTPLLVPPAMLPKALAFTSSGMQISIIGGPALGGFLYAMGASVVYGVCAVLFLVGAALMLSVRHEHAPSPREPVTMDTLLAGVRFIWERKAVLGAISLDLFAVLLGGATALLPIFAKDILHTGPWGLGLLRAAPAVGALVMSAVLTRWTIRRNVGKVMFGAVALFGVATMVFAVSTFFWLSLGSLAVLGAADMISVVVRQSLVQLDTPDAMRGRVSAVNSVFIGASNQLGEFESGSTAALLGPVGSVLVGGAGTLLVVVLWMRWFPELANRQRLTGGE